MNDYPPITLHGRDARFLLEALGSLEAMAYVNQTSKDEDEQAEYGMDAAALQMTREEF